MVKRTVEKIVADDDTKLDINADDAADLIVDDKNMGPTPEEAAAKMKKDLDDANARAARAEEARRIAEEKAENASAKVVSAAQTQTVLREQAIDSQVATAKTNLDSIKQQLKQARQAGDSDAEVELQDAMTNARYELNTAEWEKKRLIEWKENQEKIAKQPQEVKSPYTSKEQAWIDAHPEFQTNKKFARLAKIAAQDALDEGHKQDSRSYFDYIESTMREGGFLKDESDPTSGADRSSSSTAAAPSQNGNGAPIVNKNSKYPYIPNGFRIPADWVQTATDLGFDDPREYANERLELENKGNN